MKVLRVRSLLALSLMVSGGWVTLATGAGAASPATAKSVATAASGTSKWAVGDCFSSSNVDADEVDLSSKVPCSKEHSVQVTGGIHLSPSLASAGLPELLSKSSPTRPALRQAALIACNAGSVVPNVYRRLGAKLLELMLSKDVTEFIPSSLGRMGWVLPDAASFAAGSTDLICIFEPTKGTTATTSDIRQLESRQTLPKLRICRDFRADNSGAEFKSCARPHDMESLIYVSQIVTGTPEKFTDWTAGDYAPFDATCLEFAKVLIGADRADLLIRAEIIAGAVVTFGRLTFDCIAYTRNDKLQLPAGTLVGAGKSKINFPKN